jgi:hypothetical protein
MASALGAGGASAAGLRAPTAQTDAASSVTSTSATLNGVAGPGFPIVQAEPAEGTLYFFQYGTTTAYGSQTPAGVVAARQSVSAAIADLTPCTTYHFRIVVSGSGETTDGAGMTFTTLAANPDLAVKAPRRARHGRRFALRLTLASPAQVTISIARHGHDVRTIPEGMQHAGTFTARIKAPRRAGRYGLRIVASADCASQTVSTRLRVR